jgi:hypothetical protein
LASTYPSSRPESGAYGFVVRGLEEAAALWVAVPASWPELRVRVERGTARVTADRFGPDHAELRLRTVDGSVALDRLAGTVAFSMPEATPAAAVAHPFLAAPALIAAHWLGRETFHAGGFVVDGRAWAVLGDQGDGKSSLLAGLAGHDVPVLSDDVLVVDGGRALAGPRSIDLRPDAAAQLGTGVALGVVGGRERWRVALEPVAPALPLAGWVSLRWGADGDAPAVRPLRGAARLAAVAGHRGVRLPPSGEGSALLELSALPVLELCRPRAWASADAACERLLAAVAG